MHERPPHLRSVTVASREVNKIIGQFRPRSKVTFQFEDGLVFIGDHPETNFKFRSGFGITNRSTKTLENVFPGLIERVNNETGKIVILGNGASDLPVYLAERYRKGFLKDKPVVIDLFEYNLLLADLRVLKSNFLAANIEFPLERELLAVEAIQEDIKKGDLVSLLYEFGSGHVPEEAKGASLAINILGPSNETHEEQLEVLRQGGELLSFAADTKPRITKK